MVRQFMIKLLQHTLCGTRLILEVGQGCVHLAKYTIMLIQACHKLGFVVAMLQGYSNIPQGWHECLQCNI